MKMNTLQRILKNTGVMLFANIVRKVFSFIFIMLMARHLGVTDFGVITFAVGFTELFTFITDPGLNTLLVRDVAGDKSLSDKYIGNMTVMKSVFVFVFIGWLALFVNVLGYSKQTIHVVYIIAVHITLRAFSNMLYSLFQAHEKMEFQALGGILSNFFVLLGVLFAIRQNFNIIGISLIYVMGSALDLAYATIVCRTKFHWPKLQVDWSFWKKSLKEAWPLATSSVFFIIYFRIDIVMLSLIKDDLDVGIYGAAYRISEILILFPMIFMSAVFPVLSSYFKNSKSSFQKAYEKSTKFLFSLALLLALVTMLLARKFIFLMYGEGYEASVVPLQILVWGTALMFVTSIQATTFVAANRQILSLKILLMAGVLNISLNLLAIPKYGYIGASITTVITEIFILIKGLTLLEKEGYKLKVAHTWLAPIIGIMAAGFIVILLSWLNVNVFLITAAGCLVYGIIVFLIGVNKEDKSLVKFMFSR
ncbi:flippase [Acidobacteriota bacterium]